MTDIDLRPLDRADETQVRAYWEVVRDSVSERPYNTWLAWSAARSYLADPPPSSEAAHMCAWDGDRLVGVASATAPRHDNLHRSDVTVHVLPDRRREGIGTRLLEEGLLQARRWGRTVVAAEAFAPVGEESAGSLFARRHGFAVVLEDGMKVADLQATRGDWPALADEAAGHHRDYRLVTTWGPLTDEHLEAYCRLNNAFNLLAPTGDSDIEAESWDAERVREGERRGAAVGRHDLCTFAYDARGGPVGLTELFINDTAAHRVLQSGTLVLPEHRGHRLGLGLKVANHQALLERFPDAQWILTGNADVNVAMSAVNDRLGFRVVERCLELERTV